jgi:hypothetical protein
VSEVRVRAGDNGAGPVGPSVDVQCGAIAER